jgi:CheY-like chemotaxis protein
MGVASARKILVIDDNVDAADLTAEILRLHDIDVDVAYGGLEGVAAARALMPDVIFLDIGMPVMDGYAVARALRGEAALRHMKIVALTAWGDQETREQTNAAGFDLHIVKPAQFTELIDIASGARLG